MGIRNLRKFLTKHAPSVFKEVHLSKYRGKKIAVDLILYIYRFKTSHITKCDTCRHQRSCVKEDCFQCRYSCHRWVGLLLNLLLNFYKNGVHGVFVYDTKTPQMKESKVQERRHKRDMASNRIHEIQEAIESYENTDGTIVQPVLHKIMEKYYNTRPRLLLPSENIPIDLEIVKNEKIRLEKQIVMVSRKDLAVSRELITLLGFSVVDAPDEAERMCSHLFLHNLVDGVLSNDTDVLAYGTGVFLTEIRRETLYEINMNEVLSLLGLTYEQFRDFCIMCGTDYNNNIYRIGVEKAFKLIQKHGSIEEIENKEEKIDTTVLNHIRVRELFSTPDTLTTYDLENTPIQYNKLEQFLSTYRINRDFFNQFKKYDKN